MITNIDPRPAPNDRCGDGTAVTIAPTGLSLRRNFAWTFAGHAVYAACQWAVLVVIAKMTYPAAVGQFALGLAITAPILIFANQGLRDLLATDTHRRFEFRHYLRYRLVSVTAALVFTAVITWAFSYPAVVVIVGASKTVESLVDLVHGRYQQQERMDWMAISFMLRGVLSVVAVAVLLGATDSIEWAASGLIIANVTVLLLYDWRPGWLFHPDPVDVTIASTQAHLRHVSFHQATYGLAMAGLPLGLAQMLNSFSVNLPRYVLERHSGEASLGIFAAIMYLLVAGRTVMAALAQSCVARLARYYASGDERAFRSLLFRQMMLAAVFGAAGIVFSISLGERFLSLIYSPEYAGYTSVLLLAMLTSALNHFAEFTGTALTAVRSLAVQPFVLAACVAIGGIASAVLIPRHGIVGAAGVVLLIGACQLALYIFALAYVFYRQGWRLSVRTDVL